jgi:PAS domain S-box-containing protein
MKGVGMADPKKNPEEAAELRSQAEAALAARFPGVDATASGDVARVLHELRVHQVELEMQNEELRRAQAELDAARERYFDLYDLSPVGYCTISEKGMVLETNLTAAILLGVTRSALVNRPFSQFIVKEDQDVYYLHRKQLFETGMPHGCDFRMLRANAAPCWVRAEAAVVQDDEGALVCRLVLSDISERKRREEVQAFLARTSAGASAGGAVESFFNAMARYLAQGLQMDFVCIDRLEGDGLTARTVAVWCDGHFEDNVTYALKDTPCGDVVGKQVCCFPASVCQFFPRDQVLKDLRAESYVGVTLWSHTGQPIGLIAVIGRRPLANRPQVEATLALVAARAAGELERLDVEEALLQQRDLLDSIIDGSSEAIFAKDQAGRYRCINRAGARMLGYEVADIVGHTNEELLGAGWAENFRKTDELVMSTGLACEREEAGEIGGKPCIFLAHKAPWRDRSGKVIGVIGVSSDITERRRIEEVQSFLARTSAGAADEPFFNAMARYLARSLQMDFVCIDRLEGDGLTARTVAVWCDGHFEDNVTYALKDTPCGDVVGKAVCCFPASVCQFFPRDQVLKDLRAESYVGVTLWSHTGQPIGLIAVIGRSPLADRPQVESTLALVAARAAGELERLDAEEALQYSRDRLEEAQRIARIGNWEANLVTDELYWSEVIFEIFGFEAGAFKPSVRAFYNAVHPDDREIVLASERRSEQTGLHDVVHRIVRPSGEIRFIHELANRHTDDKGNLVKLRGTVQDVTARRQAEAALQESEARFQQLFDNMADGVTVYEGVDEGQDFVIVDMNRTGLELTHVCLAEVVGRRVTEVFPSVGEIGLLDVFRRVWRTGQPERHPRQEYADGHIVLWAENYVYKLPSGLVVAIYCDTSEVRRAEEAREDLQVQLTQAQKMESVGRLAGGVAHDFNNMLGVILGHAELALLKLAADHPLHVSLLEIRKAAEHSASLTRQLLAFARKQTISTKVLDLNDVVGGMLKMLERLIGEDIQLTWRPGANLWPVKVDSSQVDQILANLCVNARDAIDGVGAITIETKRAEIDAAYCADHPGVVPGAYVQLAVSDNGCGMDPETLAKLFEPFFTTKAVGKGTGLGLAMVYGAVKQNHGFVDVDSEPGRGTTFTIYLPRHAGKPEPETRTDVAVRPAERGHECILLVEDEVAILEMTRQILEGLGYAVLAAATPGEAIRLARECAGEIHLLMTDVIMPEMNGRDLAKNLLSLYPELRRLFMSGYTADVIAHRGILEDGVFFIQKPFSINGLSAKIREALEHGQGDV